MDRNLYRNFEEKLFSISIWYVLVFILLSLITDTIIVGFGIVQKVYSITVLVILSILYLRKKTKLSILAIPFNLFITLTIAFVYLFNGGINGVAPYLFLSFSLIITIITKSSHRIFHFLFILIVFFCLILIELFYSDYVFDTTDPSVKIYELAVSIFLILNASFAAFYKFVNEYENTKEEVEILKEKLENEVKEHNKMNEELEYVNKIYKDKINVNKQIHDIIIHELRSPINSIIEGINLLDPELKDKIDDESYQLYRSLEATSKHSSHVIDSLLMINKIESNKLNIKKERFNLKEVIDRELNAITTLAKINRIKINKSIDDDSFVLFDKTLFSIIFRNFVYQSIHSSFKDNKIDIVAKDETDKYEISIRDYGKGVFGDFNLEMYKGIGLDLEEENIQKNKLNYSFKLAYKLLKKTEQNLSIQSKLQDGTLVTFSIPKDKALKQA